MEKIDDRHVAFHLPEPLQLPTLMSFNYLPIMPEHYWRDKDPTASTLTPPLTSGPYQVSEFKQGRYIVYRRDPNYWGREIPVNRGRYNFDTIRFEVYRDANVTREAFRKGLIDVWDESDARYWHNGFDTPALRRGWIRKIRRNSGLEVGIREGIVLNNRRELLKGSKDPAGTHPGRGFRVGRTGRCTTAITSGRTAIGRTRYWLQPACRAPTSWPCSTPIAISCRRNCSRSRFVSPKSKTRRIIAPSLCGRASCYATPAGSSWMGY